MPEATLGPYLAAVDAYGSPAFDSDQIAASDESVRVAADQSFADLLQIVATPLSRSPTDALECRTVELSSGPAAVELPPGGTVLESSARLALSLRRYATQAFSVDLGTEPGAHPVAVQIADDRSPVPWMLGLSGAGEVRVCGLPAGSRLERA